MSLDFSLVHGRRVIALPHCGMEKSSPPEKLNIEVGEVSLTQIEQLKVSFETSDGGRWREKYVALFTAANCPYIRSICFIPKEEGQMQLVYATRDSLKKMQGFVVSYIDHPLIKKEVPHATFPITNEADIKEVTKGIDAVLIKDVQSILSYFLADQQTLGIALNFPNGAGERTTHLWTKV
jgi:hypothetical protein